MRKSTGLILEEAYEKGLLQHKNCGGRKFHVAWSLDHPARAADPSLVILCALCGCEASVPGEFGDLEIVDGEVEAADEKH